MAIIRPFKALRPAPEVANKTASVPYDVVNTEEARKFAEGLPYSLLRVTRAEIELPDDTNPYSDEVYNLAKKNLDKIIAEAPMITEEKESFYLYRLIMDGRAQVGIAATFSVQDYNNNVIMKHEKTRKDKEDDRTKHIITTSAQTGPVFLTYRGNDEIDTVVEEIIQKEQPLYDFVAPDGIQHTVWIVPDINNSLFISAIGQVEKLYIADGHHRAASAARACETKKAANPAHTGSEEYNYFIAVLFPEKQLKILPYNRVVKDLNGLSKEDFLNAVSDKFTISPSEEKEPHKKEEYTMYLDKRWYKLTPRDAIKASNSLSKSVGEKLDVSVLQNFLLNPILGIDDPRTNKRIDFIGGIRGTAELERLVDSGKFAVAFALYPVTVQDLMNISDAGEIMPPKSTWFEPKLRDGLLIHTI